MKRYEIGMILFLVAWLTGCGKYLEALGNARAKIRELEAEASAKESEARASKYAAESKYWDAKRDAIADKDNK